MRDSIDTLLTQYESGTLLRRGRLAEPGDIDHFGVGIDDLDAARVESELRAAGHDYQGLPPSPRRFPMAVVVLLEPGLVGAQ